MISIYIGNPQVCAERPGGLWRSWDLGIEADEDLAPEMGVATEDLVVIQVAKRAGEPSVVTVNCPDQTGLGCDICRVILEFGLCITRGDVSTDGRWCYVVLWVLPASPSVNVQWENLKHRLMTLCPPCPIPFYIDLRSQPTSSEMYLLKLFSVDRKGLLHDVTQVLCELELLIHRVKVSTTPDGGVVDLFFITDGMEMLHSKERQDETFERLTAVLGESINSCEIQLAEDFQQGFSSLQPVVAGELLSSEVFHGNPKALGPDTENLKKANVIIDNSLSPSHTLLKIQCVDQKGLIYDIMRAVKDLDIKVSYGRFLSDTKGWREVDLLLQQTDGTKIIDPAKQDTISSRLKLEILHPLRMMIVNRGPDTELLVANPVEASGKGRPRVFYHATLALKLLGICIFSAEIGRHRTSERQWEIYRFLLEDSRECPMANLQTRNQILDEVRKTLMGL